MDTKIQKYNSKLKNIKAHLCLKNFWGTSKATESHSIVHLVRNFPEKRQAYIRALVMDDDATTPSHLKEDTGPTSKGCLPKSLSGIEILADPSHRKRVVGGAYYKLGRKKVSISRVTNVQAATLGRHFGYWQAQMKKLTFDEMKAHKDVPIRHATGDHSQC